MSILNDIKGLFLPPVCPVCGGELHEGEGAFCMMCRTLAPQTGFWRRADNPLAERLRNEFPVVQASAFLWFVAVSRLRNNPSQTTRSSAGRWENVRDLFAVARPGALAGRHVLLVDDVVTTGSTLLSCTEALLRAVPDCRVSIAALAVSRRHFGLDR